MKVFMTLLAKKDSDHVCRMTAYAVGQKCWPGDMDGEARALDAIKILSEPDRRRIEPQAHEGRRIQRVNAGYFVINGQFYEQMMRSINRRHYKREKQAGYRAVQKLKEQSPEYKVNGTPLE